ncbi:MAG: peptidase C39 family protein [Rhodospirillaceae bacterium]|nr:peptidase C39 family protein [Rhodospirillaceae bacterium]
MDAQSPKQATDGSIRPGAKTPGANMRRVPYWNQTTDFTCGPSAVMMAMNAFDPDVGMTRPLEYTLWREANSVIMRGKGPAGCSPLGLALAAHRRGYEIETHINHRDAVLADRARNPKNREVVEIVFKMDLAELEAEGLSVIHDWPGVAGIEAKFCEGWLPVVLVSTHFVHGDHTPHWIVVTGFDPDRVYINDPWISRNKGQSEIDVTDRPIPRADFNRMACYGKRKERSVLFLRQRGA